jgi:Spy/CpxP family protein refolding chaperone
MRARLLAAALLLAASALAQAPEPESPESLPEGAGREETFYACTACHSSALIRRQQLTREGWDGIVALMVRQHGMPEPSDEERKQIVDYLAKAFPVRAPAGWRNPFAQ